MGQQTVQRFAADGNLIDEWVEELPDAPPSQAERIAALEAKLAEVAELAGDANTTAQDVARRIRDTKGPG